MAKTKLTLSIDDSVRKKAQKLVDERSLTLSGLVERFLKFMANPTFWCFKCGSEFRSCDKCVCPKCTYFVCPECKACRCQLSEESAVVAYHINRIYQYLAGGKFS